LLCKDAVRTNASEAERISAMARPVMFGAKANAAILVFLLVIPAERFQASRSRRYLLRISAFWSVEPDRRKMTPAASMRFFAAPVP
jgi:hypothetical protein